MAASAESWSDLRTLLDSGASLEEALGLEQHIESTSTNANSREENMSVHSIGSVGEVFRFKLPTANEVDLLGLQEIEEPLTVLPPFLDLRKLLEPLYIPEPEHDPSSSDEVHLKIPKQEPGGSTRGPVGSTTEDKTLSVSSEMRKRFREESSSPKKLCTKKSKDNSSSPELIDSSGNSVIDLTQ